MLTRDVGEMKRIPRPMSPVSHNRTENRPNIQTDYCLPQNLHPWLNITINRIAVGLYDIWTWYFIWSWKIWFLLFAGLLAMAKCQNLPWSMANLLVYQSHDFPRTFWNDILELLYWNYSIMKYSLFSLVQSCDIPVPHTVPSILTPSPFV